MTRNRNHEIRHLMDKGLYKALCSCKFSSGWLGKGEAQAWEDKHLRLVQQAMVHLRDQNPSVKNQWEYFQSKADDPEETRENRNLWQKLADELRPRLPHTKVIQPTEVDEPLPFEVKYTPKTRSRDQP